MKPIIFFFLFCSSYLYSQANVVKGLIFDQKSGKPLSYANLRIDGTTTGTSANFDGEFYLKTNKKKLTLIFSYIGYRSDTLSLHYPYNKKINMGLDPEAVLLPEVVVNDEDPAYAIIREAIKRKKENREGLVNFDYKAYAKRIMTSAGKMAAVEETFVKGYNKVGEWAKEFIISQHRSENRRKDEIMDFSIADNYYIDFSSDTLSIMMNLIYLPLADNAFDHYDYKLMQTTISGETEIYLIQVIPQSNIQPLLEGEITIESNRYALNSVKLNTNEGVRFVFINDLELNFVQQLGLYEKYWLPNYVETKASMSANFSGLLTVEKMTFDQFSNITEYNINNSIPDSVEYAVRSKHGFYTSDTSGNEAKPIEISREEIDSLRQIPLTLSEKKAYTELDSTMSIEKMIEIGGPLSVLVDTEEEVDTTTSAFEEVMGSFFSYGYFRNNRVTGLVFGARYDDELISENLSLNTFLGYSLNREKLEGKISLKYLFDDFVLSGIEAGYFDMTQNWQIYSAYPDLINSIGVTLGLDDYFNFYYSRGFQFGIQKKITENFLTKISYRSQEQKHLEQQEYQSIFGSKRNVRENPAIIEGFDNKLSLNLELGENPFAVQMMPESGLVAQFDLSDKAFESKFGYRRLRIAGMLAAKTIYDELFIAPYLHIIFDASIINGNYGPQHIFTPSSAYSIYSPFGVFKGLKPYHYVGTEMISLHVEHNWRSVPFQAVGLDFISDLHLDLITGVSGLRIWNKSEYLVGNNMDKPYWEAYLGISRIFAMFRVDTFYNSNDLFGVRAALGILL